MHSTLSPRSCMPFRLRLRLHFRFRFRFRLQPFIMPCKAFKNFQLYFVCSTVCLIAPRHFPQPGRSIHSLATHTMVEIMCEIDYAFLDGKFAPLMGPFLQIKGVHFQKLSEPHNVLSGVAIQQPQKLGSRFRELDPR